MREDAAEGEARSRVLPREWRWGLSALFAGELCGDDTGFLLVLESVALALADGRPAERSRSSWRSPASSDESAAARRPGPRPPSSCCRSTPSASPREELERMQYAVQQRLRILPLGELDIPHPRPAQRECKAIKTPSIPVAEMPPVHLRLLPGAVSKRTNRKASGFAGGYLLS